MIRGPPRRAAGGGHVSEPVAPQRECVDHRLGDDQLIHPRRDQPRGVEDTGMRAGQVQVARRPGPQVIADLAAVHLTHVPLGVEDRDDQRAGEMLVPGLPHEPERLEAGAEDAAGLRL